MKLWNRDNIMRIKAHIFKNNFLSFLILKNSYRDYNAKF